MAGQTDGPDKASPAVVPSPRASVWVLWGMGPGLPVPDLPIRITGGTVAHCRRERDRYYQPAKMPNGEPRWSELGIYAEGSRPPFGRTFDQLTEKPMSSAAAAVPGTGRSSAGCATMAARSPVAWSSLRAPR